MPMQQDKFNQIIKDIKRNSPFHSVPFHSDMDETQIKTLNDALATNNAIQRLHFTIDSQYNLTPLASFLKINSTIQFIEFTSDIDSEIDSDVYKTKTETLAEALAANTSVRTLACRDLATMCFLPDFLSTNTTIRRLEISILSQDLETSEPYLLNLVNFLKSNTTLQIVKFRSLKIGDKGATALGDMLKENNTLQELYLPLLLTTVDGMTALAGGLEKNRGLRKLDIDHLPGHYSEAFSNEKVAGYDGVVYVSYHIDMAQTKILFDVLATNQTIQFLHCGSTSLGDTATTHLAQVLESNTGLRTLSLGHKNIGYKGAIALAGMLKKNKTLQTLVLNGNHIGNEGVGALATSLLENTSLRELSLIDSLFNDEIIHGLAFTLARNSGLQVLRLEHSNHYYQPSVSSDSAFVLAAALRFNTTVLELSLKGQHIGDLVVDAFLPLLNNGKTKLRALCLSDNKLTDKAAISLTKALETNATIQSLDFSENHISDKGAQPLLALLCAETNKSLQTVMLHRNNISPTLIKKISDIIDVRSKTLCHTQQTTLETKERKEKGDVKGTVERKQAAFETKQSAEVAAQSTHLVFSAGAAGAPQTALALLQTTGVAKEPGKKVQLGLGGTSSDS